MLKIIKARINTQHKDISSHLLLSIFKIAEVDVVYPAPPASSSPHLTPSKLLYTILILITFLRFNFDTLFKNTVNCLSNLYNTRDKGRVSRALSNIYKDFLSILKCYKQFIEVEISHFALALGKAHITNIFISYIDVCRRKITKHIVEAVKTIYTCKLAEAMLPKYFSRDIGVISMLFGEFFFEKIASFSYGIVKSVSLANSSSSIKTETN